MIPELSFGLLAALLWGIGDYSTKKAVQAIGVKNTVFYSHVFAVLLVGLVVYFSPPVTVTWTALATGLAAGIVWGSGNAVFGKAMEKGAVSVVASVNATYAVFVVLLSVFLYGESLSLYQMLLVAAIIAGAMLVSLKFLELRKKRGWLEGGLLSFLAAGLFGIGIYFFKPLSQELGPSATLLTIYTGATLFTLAWFYFGKVPAFPASKKLGWALWVALIYVGANLVYSFGVSKYLASLIAPISAVFPLVAIGLAHFFDGERLEANQWVGIALVVAGTALLSG